MRSRLYALSFSSCVMIVLTACGGQEAQTINGSNQSNASARTTLQHAPTTANPTDAPITSSHGGSASSTSNDAGRSLLNTAMLDAEITAALPKGKSPNASDADKQALATAYLKRANAYRDAGNPSLYKFALADYNSVLLYDPSNSEAQAKRDEIVSIYRGMNRPIPQVSNEN